MKKHMFKNINKFNILFFSIFIVAIIGINAYAEEKSNDNTRIQRASSLSGGFKYIDPSGTYRSDFLLLLINPQLTYNHNISNNFSAGISLGSNIFFSNLALSGRYYFKDFILDDAKNNLLSLYTESSINNNLFLLMVGAFTTDFVQTLGVEYRNEYFIANFSLGGGAVLALGGGAVLYGEMGGEGPKFRPIPEVNLNVGYSF